MTDQPDGIERRRSPRKRVLREAQIVFQSGHVSLRCVVFDISEHGAKLLPEDGYALPDRFELRIRNGPTHRVRVVRARGRHFHVEFI